jgi:hypothetical protein
LKWDAYTGKWRQYGEHDHTPNSQVSTLTVRVALAAFLGAVTAVAILAGYTTTDAVPGGFALPAGIIGPMPPTIAPHVAAVALFGTPIPGF